MAFVDQVHQALLALDSERITKQHFQDIQDSIKARTKQIMLYSRTVETLQPLYLEKTQMTRASVKRMDDELAFADCQLRKLRQQQEEAHSRIERQEADLNERRQFATERRDKKARRQHQYNTVYYVPLLSSNYKKKYVRALDKNTMAEEGVSAVAESLDREHQQLRELSRGIHAQEEHISQIKHQLDVSASDLTIYEGLLQKFERGLQFWSTFHETCTPNVSRLIHDLINAIRRQPDAGNLDRLVAEFKVACLAYSDAEVYGVDQFVVDVDFTCARCEKDIRAWPRLDKVRTNELLCEPCYQRTKTSMVMEKKMMAIVPKAPSAKRPAALEQRHSSTSSLHSVSTTRSHLSFHQSKDTTSLPNMKNLLKRFSKNKNLAAAV